MGIHDGKGRKRKKNGGNGEKWRKIEANGASNRCEYEEMLDFKGSIM